MNNITNKPSNVVDQLVSKPSIEAMREVRISKAGSFQSRIVRKGDQQCRVNQMIIEIGRRIKDANIKQNEPNLEKLKDTLTAMSETEKENRSGISSLYHGVFSSRDDHVQGLFNLVDNKIIQREIYQKLEQGYRVNLIPNSYEAEEIFRCLQLKEFFNAMIKYLSNEIYKDGESSIYVIDSIYLRESNMGRYEYSYDALEGGSVIDLYVKKDLVSGGLTVALTGGNHEDTNRVMDRLTQGNCIFDASRR